MSPRWCSLLVALGLLAGCKKSEPEKAPARPGPAAKAKAPAPRSQAPVAPAPSAGAAQPSRSPHAHEPLPVCPARGNPLAAARRYYDRARFDDALACAARAAADYPLSPDAHSERGAALSALGQYEEAKLAYARALALDPDWPDALLGAAHLFAVSLPSTREHDELAAVYAHRGLENAQAESDDALASHFALISAMALNDLGLAEEALVRADLVLAAEAHNREAAYERAVALFELCRFEDARVAFRALRSDPERGPHALHHLGLLLEREGRFEEAEKRFAAARTRAPEDFPPPQLLSKEAFAREVEKAVARLPEDMKRDLVGVPVTAEDLPTDEDLLGGEPPLSPTILGLFRGPPIGERCEPEPGEPCRSVALYRRNLARAVTTRAELVEQIRVTLLHEVGHLRGEDDYQLAARGLE